MRKANVNVPTTKIILINLIYYNNMHDAKLIKNVTTYRYRNQL